MSSRSSVVFVALLGLTLGSGCSLTPRTVSNDSAADAFGTSETEFEFWDEVATRGLVTNHDALYGLLLATGDDPDSVPDSYAARLQRARELGWVDGDLEPNASVRVGSVARAVCEVLGLGGGVTMRVVGPTERYATRELVYRQMLPPLTAAQSLTGLEFVDLIGRLEDGLANGVTP